MSIEVTFQKDGIKNNPFGIELDPLNSYSFSSDAFSLEDGDYQAFFAMPQNCYLTVYQIELDEGVFKSAHIQQLHRVLGTN